MKIIYDVFNININLIVIITYNQDWSQR